ncbi:MAG: calcium-binding protein [Bradyrhizobiaceae bacterium]|nr:calcium-binding protein [Bradyrhizobiaceae bacterium]
MKQRVRAIGFAVVLGIAGAAWPALAASRAHLLQALDSDHDGTIDMDEARTAAAATFDRLDRDHDGTLGGRELRGRLSTRELAAADGDHDGTLTKDEYTAAMEKRFKAANQDSDETLDARELGSRHGKALQRLLR